MDFGQIIQMCLVSYFVNVVQSAQQLSYMVSVICFDKIFTVVRKDKLHFHALKTVLEESFSNTFRIVGKDCDKLLSSMC